MTTYVYKSTTGHPVVIDNLYVTPDPGLQLKYPSDILDAFIGVTLSRFDDGVQVNSDPDAAVKGYNVSNIWAGNQAAYDAIVTKDPKTLYLVT